MLGILCIYKLLLFLFLYICLPERINYEFLGKQEPGKSNIILVGASNLEYNFDYQQLAENFDSYNIIGCSYKEPNGIFVTIEKLKKLELTANDIIILCLPHSHYETAKFMPLSRNGTLRKLTKNTLLNAIDFSLSNSLKNILSLSVLDIGRIYTHCAIKGNDVTHERFSFPICQTDSLYKTCWKSKEDKFHIISNSFEIKYINTLHSSLIESIPSKIVFRFPPIVQGDYELNIERISYLQKKFTFINKFEESIYSKKYFFNQWYHLNNCGRNFNTHKINKELQKYMASEIPNDQLVKMVK